jgi:hypothetical protein
MAKSLIANWASTHSEHFRKKPMIWQHSAHQSPLFSDEKLIELIEKHPRDLSDFCTMGAGANDMASWRGGNPGDYSGEELLKAVRSGRLWINLRKAFNIHDEYAAMLNTMIGELKALNPGFDPVRIMGGLLISSPSAGVPYHIDRSDVLLWHIRGHKRVWVYPIDDETLPESEIEEILLHEHNDDIPYDAAMDEKALVYDLQPGQAASWPLHAPHRVLNLGDMNVSITTEYSPFSTIVQNGAHITNGILRRRLGLNLQIEQQGPLSRFVRFAASRVLRKMKLVKAKTAHDGGYLFDIDLETKTAVRELQSAKAAA